MSRRIVWPDPIDPTAAGGIEALGDEIRRRLGPPADVSDLPLVSIVVLNRDGADHLRRLLAGLVERTDYPRFELIVVDNDSSDDSLDFIRSVEAPFPISIVANHHNESFSDANNQGVERACGELVLFLNNDVEPFERGWLRELVGCLRANQAGLVGATLVFPKKESAWGYLVQHRAMRLLDDPVVLPADLHGHGEDPFAEGFGEDADAVVPTGACMLIKRDLLLRIGGFTHGYIYGGEDIDLALKVLEQGCRVMCSGRSFAIHRFSATRRKGGADPRESRRRNTRLLWERWGPRLRREYELDRLAGGGVWAAPGQPAPVSAPSREEVEALGFCLKSSETAADRPGDPLEDLSAELKRRGHRCAILRGNAVDDLIAFNYDVAVHMRGPARYVPKRSQLNVLWALGHLDSLTAIECNRYDLVLADVRGVVERLQRAGTSTPVRPLDVERRPAAAVDAILSRAEELSFPTRISPRRESVTG
jgi:GT2 family glycosyltransferase